MRLKSNMWVVLVILSALHFPVFAQDKVVYHFDNAAVQTTKGLGNIRNHLDVAPSTQGVVVAHADGIDFLLDSAKDKRTRMSTMRRW